MSSSRSLSWGRPASSGPSHRCARRSGCTDLDEEEPGRTPSCVNGKLLVNSGIAVSGRKLLVWALRSRTVGCPFRSGVVLV